MSETVFTVRLDDSGSADSVVARSPNRLLFAMISYTIYLLCSLRFNFVLGRLSKDPAHKSITYYSSTSFLSVKSVSCKDTRLLQLIICTGRYRFHKAFTLTL